MAEAKKAEMLRGDCVVTFQEVPHAIMADRALKNAGIPARLIAPPPKLRMGCSLGVEVFVKHTGDILDIFRSQDIAYEKIIALEI